MSKPVGKMMNHSLVVARTEALSLVISNRMRSLELPNDVPPVRMRRDHG
jgi:hypothetical protein